jgi:hypothetical protein
MKIIQVTSLLLLMGSSILNAYTVTVENWLQEDIAFRVTIQKIIFHWEDIIPRAQPIIVPAATPKKNPNEAGIKKLEAGSWISGWCPIKVTINAGSQGLKKVLLNAGCKDYHIVVDYNGAWIK